VRSRLSAAAKEYTYSDRWSWRRRMALARSRLARSTSMADLHACSRWKLCRGLGDILYVYMHAVLHICNEAAVEGMGSIISMHGDKTRARPPVSGRS